MTSQVEVGEEMTKDNCREDSLLRHEDWSPLPFSKSPSECQGKVLPRHLNLPLFEDQVGDKERSSAKTCESSPV